MDINISPKNVLELYSDNGGVPKFLQAFYWVIIHTETFNYLLKITVNGWEYFGGSKVSRKVLLQNF